MLNRWNKLVAIAAFALAMPVVANAQSSRVEGMSLQGDYIKDYTSIYTYPSSVSHVGNLVYGEFGGGSDRGVGAVLGNLWEGRMGTWAIHLRQFEPSLGQATTNSHPGIGTGGADLNTNNNHSFDLMWGKRMGGTSIGLRLNRSFFENETTIPLPTPGTTTTVNLADSNVFNRNIFGFGGGVGFEINPNTMAEFSLLWQSRTFEVTTSPGTAATNRNDDSPTSYELAGRLMWQWQPNVLVVPVFKWYNFDYSYSITRAGGATATRDATQKGWQLGVAGNWTLNQNDLFVLGLTAASNTFEQDATINPTTSNVFASSIMPGTYKKLQETIYPQIFAALETHVNSWLTLRFGATQDVQAKLDGDVFDASAQNSSKVTFSRFNMELGCGVKVGGLQFDAIMDPDFYNNVTHVASLGAPEFPKVTATYAF
jgi:hypothetical protein